MADNEQQVALITGATSGIGLAVAETLAGRGLKVFICARNADAVQETAGKLRSSGYQADGVAADVRRPGDVRQLVGAAVERYGHVDVLVNNAGRSGGGVTAEIEDDLWYDVIDTNLNSVLLMTRERLRSGKLLERGWGRIINIASTCGK